MLLLFWGKKKREIELCRRQIDLLFLQKIPAAVVVVVVVYSRRKSMIPNAVGVSSSSSLWVLHSGRRSSSCSCAAAPAAPPPLLMAGHWSVDSGVSLSTRHVTWLFSLSLSLSLSLTRRYFVRRSFFFRTDNTGEIRTEYTRTHTQRSDASWPNRKKKK